MRPVKIVVIGAGSASFGSGTLSDLLQEDAVAGSTLSLVDVDGESLTLMGDLAKRANQEWGSGLTIECHTDRRQALPDADYVIVSVEVEREKRWALDWEIPAKHGIIQPMGENGGPGGFAHAMRNIPILVGIAHDMERLCPKAWLLNFTNPVHRLTEAATLYSSIATLGLCHGIYGTRNFLARIMEIAPRHLDAKAAGINHFTWILDLRLTPSGGDAYPLLRKTLKRKEAPGWELSKEMFEFFDLWPSPGDDHIAEYLHHCHLPVAQADVRYGLPSKRWLGGEKHRAEKREQIRRTVKSEESLKWLARRSGERASSIILGREQNRNSLELAVNIPNCGYIENVTEGAAVEVPALVSHFGVQGLPMGPLPPALAAICQTQTAIAQLTAKAAVEQSRQAALQALLLDPTINDTRLAATILDDFQAAHRGLMPELK